MFSPNNGIYEYSAVVTDTKVWSPEDLLLFVCGRSAQENSTSELKTSFAFDYISTNTYQANSAYLQIRQMAYNYTTSNIAWGWHRSAKQIRNLRAYTK